MEKMILVLRTKDNAAKKKKGRQGRGIGKLGQGLAGVREQQEQYTQDMAYWWV